MSRIVPLLKFTHPEATRNLDSAMSFARTHYDRGELGPAKHYLDQALAICEANSDNAAKVLMHRARVLHDQGDLEGAKADYDRALQISRNPLDLMRSANIAGAKLEANQLKQFNLHLDGSRRTRSWLNETSDGKLGKLASDVCRQLFWMHEWLFSSQGLEHLISSDAPDRFAVAAEWLTDVFCEMKHNDISIQSTDDEMDDAFFNCLKTREKEKELWMDNAKIFSGGMIRKSQSSEDFLSNVTNYIGNCKTIIVSVRQNAEQVNADMARRVRESSWPRQDYDISEQSRFGGYSNERLGRSNQSSKEATEVAEKNMIGRIYRS